MAEKSFSLKVKEEACQVLPEARHCQIAELAGLLSFCDVWMNKEGAGFCIENKCAKKKLIMLLEKIFCVKVRDGETPKKSSGGHMQYVLNVDDKEKGRKILEAVKHPLACGGSMDDPVDPIVYQRSCCKRAFVRGSFLAAGSVINPDKSYHLEIVCPGMKKALALCLCINSFWQDEDNMEAKIIERSKKNGKKCYVVYLKEGNQISDMLNICETYRCLMELENIRVKKEIANSLNRKQNCEMANMVKTINAAQEQKDDILVIKNSRGLHSLPDELFDLAVLRLEDTEITMKELGERLTPPIGKSGVNHRFRRIHRIAEEIRGEYKGIV